VEKETVSVQEVRVFQALRAQPGLTGAEIAAAALVAEATARTYAEQFVQAGIAERSGDRYRLKARAAVTDTAPLDRLERAAELLSGIA
jgi:DNA-binding IclR family transcriptional regulator